MDNLKTQQDYSKVNLGALRFLFNKITAKDQDTKMLVLDAIIKKYFEERTQKPEFNLYSFLSTEGRAVSNHKVVIAKTLSVELTNGVLNTLPSEHYEAFFNVLTQFIEYIEKQEQDSDGTFEMSWDFTNIPGLLMLLKNISNTNIKSAVLKQKINNLMQKVEISYNQKLKEREEKKAEETGLVKVNSETELAESVGFKKLTISKSKLTKSEAENMLKNIDLYDAEDKAKIINIALSKWEDAITSLPALAAYKYFKENPYKHRFVNPIRSLYGEMEHAKWLYDISRHSYMDSKPPSSINHEELINEGVTWYLSLDGATEQGANLLKVGLLNKLYGENTPASVSDCLNALVLQPALDVLRPTKGKDISELVKTKVDVNKVNLNPLKVTIPTIKDVIQNKYIIEEPNYSETSNMSILEYYWRVYSALNKQMFEHYEGIYIANATELKVKNPVYTAEVQEFIDIFNSYRLTGDGLVYLKENYNSGWRCDSKGYIEDFVRTYFCNHTITEEIAWDLIGTVEKYHAFYAYTNTQQSSGSYHNSMDFLRELLPLIFDKFNFSKNEDRQLFFKYCIYTYGVDGKCGAHRKKTYDFSIYSKTLEKLEKEAPEVLEYINDYAVITNDNKKDILEFIAIYFGVQESRW